MSFLKIKDPIRRDLIVEEFQEKFITERLGDISAQRELSKLFKPITETQKQCWNYPYPRWGPPPNRLTAPSPPKGVKFDHLGAANKSWLEVTRDN